MAARKPMGARTTINQRGESRQAKVRKKGPALGILPGAAVQADDYGPWPLAPWLRHGGMLRETFSGHRDWILTTANVAKLNSGKAPLLEPGLDELIAAGFASKKLSFTTERKRRCANADVLWVCYDTPVNENDESDVEFVLGNIRNALARLRKDALVLISAQLPVGTCAKLEKEFPQFSFACSPENLRLGKAIDSFEKAERIVVGLRNDGKKEAARKTICAIHAASIVHAHGIGGDGQARAQFVPRAFHHVHQRNRAPLRTHRRGREGSGGRTQKRAAHRSASLPGAGRAVCGRHAGARRGDSHQTRPRRMAKSFPSFRRSSKATICIAAGRFAGCNRAWAICAARRLAFLASRTRPIPTRSGAARRLNCANASWTPALRVRAFDPAVKKSSREPGIGFTSVEALPTYCRARTPPRFAPSGRSFARRIGRKSFRKCAAKCLWMPTGFWKRN